jgi:cystathionine beta-lyase/cystathionine gamma-synthase
MDRETLLQHLGEEEKPYGAVTPPITQTSLFVFNRFDDFVNRTEDGPGEPYVYSRVTNPTNEIAEAKLAMLEGAGAGRLFNSGMAAISASVMSAVAAGSHVVCIDTAYGPLQQFLRDYMPKFGVTTTFVPGISTEEILDAIRPETTLIYLESPSSILFRMQDFSTISAHCKAKGITTITDNSYSSNPPSLGLTSLSTARPSTSSVIPMSLPESRWVQRSGFGRWFSVRFLCLEPR